MESLARRRPTVGVDADDRIRAHGVGCRGPPVNARTEGRVVFPRELCARTQLIQLLLYPHHDVPGERMLRVSVTRGGTCRLAGFGAAAAVGDSLVTDESFAPLWPGSRKTAVPATLAAADAVAELPIDTSDQRHVTTSATGKR